MFRTRHHARRVLWRVLTFSALAQSTHPSLNLGGFRVFCNAFPNYDVYRGLTRSTGLYLGLPLVFGPGSALPTKPLGAGRTLYKRHKKGSEMVREKPKKTSPGSEMVREKPKRSEMVREKSQKWYGRSPNGSETAQKWSETSQKGSVVVRQKSKRLRNGPGAAQKGPEMVRDPGPKKAQKWSGRNSKKGSGMVRQQPKKVQKWSGKSREEPKDSKMVLGEPLNPKS